MTARHPSIRFQMNKRNVSVLVPRGGYFLVVGRPDGSGYCPPGGKVEACETSLSAAVRELCEEAGIVADPDQLQFLWSAPYGDGHTTVYVLDDYLGGEPVSPEGLEVRWMTWRRICRDVFGDFYSAIPSKVLARRLPLAVAC